MRRHVFDAVIVKLDLILAAFVSENSARTPAETGSAAPVLFVLNARSVGELSSSFAQIPRHRTPVLSGGIRALVLRRGAHIHLWPPSGHLQAVGGAECPRPRLQAFRYRHEERSQHFSFELPLPSLPPLLTCRGLYHHTSCGSRLAATSGFIKGGKRCLCVTRSGVSCRGIQFRGGSAVKILLTHLGREAGRCK